MEKYLPDAQKRDPKRAYGNDLFILQLRKA